MLILTLIASTGISFAWVLTSQLLHVHALPVIGRTLGAAYRTIQCIVYAVCVIAQLGTMLLCALEFGWALTLIETAVGIFLGVMFALKTAPAVIAFLDKP